MKSLDTALPQQVQRPELTTTVSAANIGEARRLQVTMFSVARGDHAAFAELYDLTCARVYGTVLRVLDDPDRSEETTRETYLQIWRTATSFDPARGSVLSWIITLAHQRAIDRVRSTPPASNRHRAYGATLSRQKAVTEEAGITAASSALTELQREAIHLAYYSGSTYREVAEHLGISCSATVARIRDAVVKLRAARAENRR